MTADLVRVIVDVMQKGSTLPDDWSDVNAVMAYLNGLIPPLARGIAIVATMVKAGRFVWLSHDEIEARVAEELEMAGASIPPTVVQAIVALVIAILQAVLKK
jgi:hypothetical protein